MIAPTHVVFAGACGMIGGASGHAIVLICAGSLLPDIDHPRSFVGRLLPFISIPLHKRFGHRREVHSIILWGIVAAIGYYWTPLDWLYWIGLGALTHVVVDLLNVSGVRLLLPFSEKVCVLFGRQWRFPVASKTELGWLVMFCLMAWVGHYLGEVGGVRAFVGVATGSPRIAYQRYMKEGTRICFLQGTLRHIDGRVEEGSWLVIGQEGQERLAIWDEEERMIIHLPSQAEFLSVRLEPTEEQWQTMAITGWATTKKPAFFYDGSVWKFAPAGAVVFGRVIARELEVETDITS